MKKLKRTFCLVAAAAFISVSSISMAATPYQTPANLVADLTGRTLEDVMQEHYETGKTFGMIASEAGKLDEFKAECLNLKEELLKEDVKNGLLTKEEADEILDAIKERQTYCDGTGYGSGRAFNRERGAGRGQGRYGRGQGQGYNQRSCCRSCLY